MSGNRKKKLACLFKVVQEKNRLRLLVMSFLQMKDMYKEKSN